MNMDAFKSLSTQMMVAAMIVATTNKGRSVLVAFEDDHPNERDDRLIIFNTFSAPDLKNIIAEIEEYL